MLIEIFSIAALVMSAVFHEYAHGYAAHMLGDDTAKYSGRLTLNPLKHLDLVGSVILPILLIMTKAGFVIGWAKPVPYNPYNLRDQKYGNLKVALAGPGTNFLIALIFGLTARFMPLALNLKQTLVVGFLRGDDGFLLGQTQGSFLSSLFVVSIIICVINLALMIFNLIPVPPLDGSKVLMDLLPYGAREKFYRLEQYGIFIILFLLMFGFFSFVWPLIIYMFSLITGLS
jgi:Zn-dependent protease